MNWFSTVSFAFSVIHQLIISKLWWCMSQTCIHWTLIFSQIHYSEVPMLLQLVWSRVKSLYGEKHSQCAFYENISTMRSSSKRGKKLQNHLKLKNETMIEMWNHIFNICKISNITEIYSKNVKHHIKIVHSVQRHLYSEYLLCDYVIHEADWGSHIARKHIKLLL